MRSFRWGNVSIPQGNIFILALGVTLHIWLPLRLFASYWLKHLIGWPMLLLGILLTLWAVTTIQKMDISKPTKIIVSGPYAFGRNPMYVAWTAIYTGITTLFNMGWLILLLPVLLAVTHYVVRREEQQLEQQFGETYRQYCQHVRRYL